MSLIVGGCALALVVASWGAQRRFLWDPRPRNVDTPAERVVRAVPPDALVVADLPFQLYLDERRSSYVLPSRETYLTRQPNQKFDDELNAWTWLLRQHGGYVIFITQTPLLTVARPDDMLRHVGMRLIASDDTTKVYEVSSQ